MASRRWRFVAAMEPNTAAQGFPARLHKRKHTMGIIILIIVGGILGWLASIVMRTDAQQGIFLNVVVGIVGALLAGLLLNPLIGGGSITEGDFSVSSLLVSFLGAVVLLAIVNLVRRGSVR
jgi:uncharacterized membrane protein YeaQ/YmgE (transglycosylase-associated protein family)